MSRVGQKPLSHNLLVTTQISMYHGKLSHHANIFTITGKPEKQSATLLLPTSQIHVQIHINILKPELAYKDVNVGIEKSRKHTLTMLGRNRVSLVSVCVVQKRPAHIHPEIT